ncbi:double-strand break repair protein AddB [Pseudohoeflea coraliihabitans]|uniref:Double-strand break repair protein AddB n=1 Tax=Pseudohoeflea coraliihabitans TaxID=2860393 RepID=A0ABS6WT15_9HYPH|nr:double-strand break repair protein AddB [Pseudohoeflea sp. DP4N28-3]MBW3099103.1 double-strand break repair protein AddB [Pseudohoeflea sp. DP4N28-3]
MSGASRLYTIPPGVNFLATLADTLVCDRLGFGLADPLSDPLALANTTIYLPTRRAVRVLRSEFADRLGGKSAILPVLRALGETDEDSGFFDEATPAALALPPPADTIDSVLSLAELVIAWKKQLPKAVAAHLQGAAMVAPANPADAIWLARALYDLVQSIEAEEADFSALDSVVSADLQQWWQLTAEFLRVARDFWPALLGERQQSSPAAHHNAAIDAETARLEEHGARGPVIVAGSTGTRPSTARLIRAVARYRQGAVILPGLDQNMSLAHWRLLSEQVGSAGFSAANAPNAAARLDAITRRSHPQFGLKRLLDQLGISLDSIPDIPSLATPPNELAARNSLVSLALLPASATAAWADRQSSDAEDASALAAVTLIEAANEREEAEALAAAIRAALEPTEENAEPVAALVTPDRNLARRVVIELARYGIDADDSGGRLLSATPQGSLARLVAATAFSPGDPVALAALIKHPLAHFGASPLRARRLAENVELLALRGGVGEASLATLPDRAAAAAARRNDRHAPHALGRLDDAGITEALAHATRIRDAFEPIFALADPVAVPSRPVGATAPEGDLPQLAVADLALATALTLEAVVTADCPRDDRSVAANGGTENPLDLLWSDEAGRALAGLLSGCRDSASSLTLSGYEWIGALDALLASEQIKPDGGGHPRAFVWGALEARLQQVDTVLLAGLNEGTWPAPGTEDAFLSRAMKAAIGLEPPERRIGQATHDFQMAMAMPKVVLSRALRAGRAPTVASRWVQRLDATAAPRAVAAMRARGSAILARLRQMPQTPDTRDVLNGAGRPQPRPPSDRQPESYTFSEVGTLRRDPYSIYARRILRLETIEPFIADPGPRERGTVFHAIMEEFLGPDLAAEISTERLLHIADRHLAEPVEGAVLPPEIARIWRNRLARAAPDIIEWELDRRKHVARRIVEAYGKFELTSGVSLRGIADRIDISPEGTAGLIDYKTGMSPSLRQARTLLDPQLPLEAFVLQQGGFSGLAPHTVSQMHYLRLNKARLYAERVDKAGIKEGEPDYSTEALIAAAVREFEGLVLALREGRRGFMSRVIPRSARDFAGDYDHLARVAEWQTMSDAEGGGDD